MWKRLFKLAYRHTSFKVVGTDAAGGTLTEHFDWHEVKVKRYKYLMDCNVELLAVWLAIICVILEPLRYLTSWFMKRASVVTRVAKQQAGKRPPLCDLVFPLTCNKSTAILQFLIDRACTEIEVDLFSALRNV